MRRLDVFQDYGEETLTVEPGTSVGQTFVAHHDNLAGVRFSVSNPNLGGEGEYIFRILDDQQTVLRTFVVKESNLGWQYTFRYDFVPINNSKGKTYILNLAYGGATASAQNQNNLKVAYSASDRYEEGTAYLNQKPQKGDLTFSTYYQVGVAQFFRDSLNDFTTRLTYDKNFIVVYLAILVVLIAVVLKRITSKNTP